MGASPGAAVALTRMNAEIDIRDVLPSIRVPTLVLHRTGDRCLKVEEGRYLASRIPGATFVELPGDDHLPFVGDQDAILDEIERFLSHAHVRTGPERVLASVLTVPPTAAPPTPSICAACSSARWPGIAGEASTRTASRWWRRSTVPAARSSAAARWSPSRSDRASRSAPASTSASATRRRRSGPIVEISGDLAAAAGPARSCVSRTVVDLVPGSGLQFVDRGALRLPGLPRDLPVLAASRT